MMEYFKREFCWEERIASYPCELPSQDMQVISDSGKGKEQDRHSTYGCQDCWWHPEMRVAPDIMV
jgi:hypothetical protein